MSLQPSTLGTTESITTPGAGPGAPVVLTTELIQKYLDENQQLIQSILENQNLGRLEDCSLFQARLQQNLLYLASLAETVPSPSPSSSSSALPLPSTSATPAPTPISSVHSINQQPIVSPVSMPGVTQNPSLGTKYNLRPPAPQQPLSTQTNGMTSLSMIDPQPVTESRKDVEHQSAELEMASSRTQHSSEEDGLKDSEKGEARGYWSPQEHEKFLQAIAKYKSDNQLCANQNQHTGAEPPTEILEEAQKRKQ